MLSCKWSAIQRKNSEKLGKKVHLKHLSKDCRNHLQNADAIIDVNASEDPRHKLALAKA